jgi:hypothetical protein
MAADCIVPCDAEETGDEVSVSARAESTFVAEGEGVVSGVVVAGDAGVEIAADATGAEVEIEVFGTDDAFDPEIAFAGINDASESRKYHAPLAAAAIRTAAMAIQIPLPLPRSLSAGVLLPSSELANS